MTGKRIGIMTMHRIHNYGSVLQAFALQKVITSMGYDCEIIDYIFPNKKINITWKVRIANFFCLPTVHLQGHRIKVFCEKFLKLSAKTYYNSLELKTDAPVYDIYLTGSDQVWNPIHVKDDTSFLLSFVSKEVKKISYSSSFALKQLDNKYIETYQNLLNQYEHISVRESNGASIIKELTGKDAPITLDPTLLLTKDNWIDTLNLLNKKRKEKYILIYILKYAFDPTPYAYDLIKFVQKNTGYKIITLNPLPNEFKKFTENIFDADPKQFLELFMNASFVITSSFHGTVFASNFKVPFYSIVKTKENQDDRQYSFLRMIGLEHRAVSLNTNFSDIDTNLNFDFSDSILSELREQSKNYLKYSLNT